MTLWTMSVLHPARKLYENRGFVLSNDEPVTQFGMGMSSLTYTLELQPADLALHGN